MPRLHAAAPLALLLLLLARLAPSVAGLLPELKGIAPTHGQPGTVVAAATTGVAVGSTVTCVFDDDVSVPASELDADTWTCLAPSTPYGEAVSFAIDVDGAPVACDPACEWISDFAPPNVTHVAPSVQFWNQTVTLTGDGLYETDACVFLNQDHVQVAETSATPLSASAATCAAPSLGGGGDDDDTPVVLLVQAHTWNTTSAWRADVNVTLVPEPLVQSVSPLTGIPGQPIQVTGSHLRRVSQCMFDTMSSPVVTAMHSNSTFYCFLPDTAAAGLVNIALRTQDAFDIATGETFDVLPAVPAEVTSVTPSQGLPGTLLTVNGKGFSERRTWSLPLAPRCVLQDLESDAMPATFIDHSSVQCHVPNSAPDGEEKQVYVVFGASKSGASPDATFKALVPTVTGVTPSVGAVGALLDVTGTNFIDQGPIACLFGASAQSVAERIDDTLLRCPVPEHVPSGELQLRVRVDTATTTMSTPFRAVAPRLSSVLPEIGRARAGTLLVLNGTGLVDDVFDSAQCEFLVPGGTAPVLVDAQLDSGMWTCVTRAAPDGTQADVTLLLHTTQGPVVRASATDPMTYTWRFSTPAPVTTWLRTLYTATGGAAVSGWHNASMWAVPHTDPCDTPWYGVVCDSVLSLDGREENARISALHLNDNHLVGSLPSQSPGLAFDTLEISNAGISGTLPAWLAAPGTAPTTLDVSACVFHCPLPELPDRFEPVQCECSPGAYTRARDEACSPCEAGTYGFELRPGDSCKSCPSGEVSSAGQAVCAATCPARLYHPPATQMCIDCGNGGPLCPGNAPSGPSYATTLVFMGLSIALVTWFYRRYTGRGAGTGASAGGANRRDGHRYEELGQMRGSALASRA